MTKSRGINIKRGLHTVCSVPGCDRKHHSRGYCCKHSHKYLAYGDPLASRGPDKGAVSEFINDVALKHTSDDCLTWPFNTDGHGYGSLSRDGKQLKAHRVICEAAHGKPPSSRYEAAHGCGRGHFGCVNPNHLRWATPGENQTDKLRHGTHNRGSRHPSAKLTENQAREIMELKGRESQSGIAKRYGVSAGAVADIHKGRNWSWLTGKRIWAKEAA